MALIWISRSIFERVAYDAGPVLITLLFTKKSVLDFFVVKCFKNQNLNFIDWLLIFLSIWWRSHIWIDLKSNKILVDIIKKTTMWAI